MKKKDFEYTGVDLGNGKDCNIVFGIQKGGIVGDIDKYIKDHINKGRTPSGECVMTDEQVKYLKAHLCPSAPNDPVPISGKALIQGLDVKGKVFTASATDCKLRFEGPSEEQQKELYIANKRAEEVMECINTAIVKCASKLSKEHPLGEVILKVDDDITVTVQIELKKDAEQK